MNTDVLLRFLSEESVKLHVGYCKDMRLKYSILEKSVPEIKGKTIRDIMCCKCRSEIKDKALTLASRIKAHELYFSSFSCNPTPCPEIRKYYSSEARFLYELLLVAQGSESDFIFIRQGKGRKPEIITSDLPTPFLITSPTLAIDLCEHAYFGDYLFDRDAYLKNAINLLDINKIFSGANSEIYLDTIV